MEITEESVLKIDDRRETEARGGFGEIP